MKTSFQSGRTSASVLAETINSWAYPTCTDTPVRFLAERKLEFEAMERILQYRLLAPVALQIALTQVTACLAGGGLISITKGASEYSLFVGGSRYADMQAATSAFPDCRQQQASKGDPIWGNYPFGGVICGIPTEASPDWDSFFRMMPNHSVITLLIGPAPETLHTDISSLRTALVPYQKKQIPSGFYGQKSREVEDPVIEKAVKHLERLSERLEKMDSSALLACLWYAATTSKAAERCGNLLSACLRAVSQPIEETTWCFDGFYFPYVTNGAGSTLPTAQIFRNSSITIRTASELARLLPIPREALSGCVVVKEHRDDADLNLFDITPHASISSDCVRVGQILGAPNIEYVPIDTFSRHCLIAGSTGSGKTTVIKNLIVQFHQKNIPTLIIEPVKEEFKDLPEYGVPTVTFSTGASGRALFFNPMIPERFTTIRSHIKTLVAALTVFDDQAPIPQALEMCLCSLYQEHGWMVNETVVSFAAKSFPTIPELLDYVLPFLKNKCPLYQGDAKVNVPSALYTRLNQLASYQFLRGTEKLPIDSLLKGNVRVQFDSLNEASDKCFFGLFLLNAINTSLRNMQRPEKLSRIVVIDEAHNLLLKGKEGGLQSITSRVADSLLSEIRSYGTGFIIADQMPSRLTETAIANTAIKVVMSLSHENDLSAVSSHLMLSDTQKRQIFSLPAGHAIISISGTFQTVHVHMDQAIRNTPAAITMCQFCPYHHICARESVESLTKGLPLNAYAQQLSGAINTGCLQRAIQTILSHSGSTRLSPVEKRCLYGLIVERLQSAPMRNYLCSIYTE